MDSPSQTPKIAVPEDITPHGAADNTPSTETESPNSNNRDTGSKAKGDIKDTRGNMAGESGSRCAIDKRKKYDESQPSKRQKVEDGEPFVPIYATQFSKEDIEADKRRPKKKVAVLMGYSGTGYHGMQMNPTEKTIEGELFPAFVAAGAISKANAMEPKKSSFVRCARTDKGVHAAGNIVSLKLIVEDPDVVKKINENLPEQIRVWGIETTTKSFSSYQLCDSRIYEYLIPTSSFLPPHPSTYLAQKITEIAEKEGDLDAYKQRQQEVSSFWEETDNEYIKPILDKLPEETRQSVLQALCLSDSGESGVSLQREKPLASAEEQLEKGTEDSESELPPTTKEAVKAVRAAYFKAKRAYRIQPDRLARVSKALDLYVGTRNFHNYTIQKLFRDPSAKRVIKSFKVAGDPIIINGTEWLSLKVHGQSFMMHQIRKMVAMVALLVRCGSDIQRIPESYQKHKIPIPKAPGLGLLLERPIFDSYNNKAVRDFGKDPIDFSKHDKEIEEFKQREIYQRIFREEEESNAFGNFFNHVDTFREDDFLYLTSRGIPTTPKEAPAAEEATMKAENKVLAKVECESEEEIVNGGEEGG